MEGSLNLFKTEVFSSNLLPLLTSHLLLLGLFFKVLESPFLFSTLISEEHRVIEVVLPSPFILLVKRWWQFLANPELDPKSCHRHEVQSSWPKAVLSFT